MKAGHRSIVALAAAGALHCGGGPSDSDPDSEEAPPDVQVADAGTRVPAEAPDDRPGPAALALGERGPRVSRTVGDDGSVYLAGLFSGALQIGSTRLVSRGGTDVFVVRLSDGGAVVWARAVGSRASESDPRVTVEGGAVNLLGVTRGEVDCGGGPLSTWSSPMFFLCVYAVDGTLESGGSFPTGTP